MPAYGYSQDDLGEWSETGIDPHDRHTCTPPEGDDVGTFMLRNASPTTNPERFETVNGRQRDLFIGLDDLPGQTYLFGDVNTD